jgi:hypothetical protein
MNRICTGNELKYEVGMDNSNSNGIRITLKEWSGMKSPTYLQGWKRLQSVFPDWERDRGPLDGSMWENRGRPRGTT